MASVPRGSHGCVSFWISAFSSQTSTSRHVPVAGFDLSRQTFTVQAGTPLVEVERNVILHTLHLVNGNKRKAAELLGIGVATLYRKMEEYGLEG